MSIKDFTILAKLGQGAYSSVYKVHRLADGKDYALKKVKLGNLSEKQLENALNQVRILASINNANIVSYKEAFLEGKNLCIIMEFADGGDLYQKIVLYKKKKRYFEENEIWNVLIQITRGLKTLHDLNIFHRDLKSANVFLTKDGLAKLGDMNVSKIAKNGLLYTQTGTPYYASPEVWKDQPYDSKSDIWSFGCVIYQMTTLQPPFKAQDMQGLFKAVTQGVYSAIPNIYSKQLGSIIKMMLQQKPNNRPSTEKLLKSSLLSKKAVELNIGQVHLQTNQQLLRTIRVPKKLHYLTDRLPKSNYQILKTVGDESQGKHLSNSYNQQQRQQRKSTFPRLDNMIRYQQEGIHKKENKRLRKKTSNGNLLIEGRSKIISALKNDKSQQIVKQIKRIHQGRYKQYQRNQSLKVGAKKVQLPPIKY